MLNRVGQCSDRRTTACTSSRRMHRLSRVYGHVRCTSDLGAMTAGPAARRSPAVDDRDALGPAAVHPDAPWIFPSGTLVDAQKRVCAATSANLFVVTPMKGHYTQGEMEIGAHVSGLDLRQPLSATVTDALRAALLVHKVLVLRDQPISNAQQVALASAFGPPTVGHVFLREPRHRVSGYPEVFRLHRDGVSKQDATNSLAKIVANGSQGQDQSGSNEGGRSWWHRRWHTDVTGAINPPWLSVLRAEVTSPTWSSHPWVTEHVHPSGDYPSHTHWVNLAAAYRDLPQALKDTVNDLFGFHESPGNSGDKASEHPIVAVHPETDEGVLNISPLTLQRVVGLSDKDGEELLGAITRHVFSCPRWIMRWELMPGDVVLWDNRATMHLAPVGLPLLGSSRAVHRVTCKGQPFVSPSSRPSRIVSGSPILSAREEVQRGTV